jgi:hypothetical protein
MSGANSDYHFGRADGFGDNSSGIIRASVVEEASLVRSMLRESASEICDRCLDPLRSIKGIVIFYPLSANLLTHLGQSEWALCSICLSALKEIGSPQFTCVAGEN